MVTNLIKWYDHKHCYYDIKQQMALNFIYSQITAEEKKRIMKLSNDISKKFDRYNTKVCSNCKAANLGTRKDIRIGKDYYEVKGKDVFTLYIIDEDKMATKECGCCTHCAHNKGYFNDSDDVNSPLLQMAAFSSNFDRVYGFLDSYYHCCTIPRPLRSKTCLRYSCGSDDNILDGVRDNLNNFFSLRDSAIKKLDKSLAVVGMRRNEEY